MSSNMITKGDAADPNTATRRSRKTMTYVNGAGTGATGTVALFTVTGAVLIQRIVARCTTSLTGASATITLGVTGNTALFIAATTATGITSALIWTSTSPATGGVAIPALMKDVIVNANISNTVAVANITGGVVVYEVDWLPFSTDGNLVAA